MLRGLLFAIPIVLLLGGTVIAAAYLWFDREMRDEIARLESGARDPVRVVTAEMIAGLPEPAQRYFKHAGVIGQPMPRIVRLTQRGRIRSSAEASWMAFEAEETYSTNPPGFVWRAWLPSRSTPVALGRDLYLEGAGSILIKMAALFPLADEQGNFLKAAGLMRYLNEMAWFPAALLGENVAIMPIDDSSFGVAVSDRGMTAEAVMIVDAEGRLRNFRARRYNTGTRSMEVWETPLTDEGPLAGLTLPTRGSAVWKLAGGDLTYIELEVISLAYEY